MTQKGDFNAEEWATVVEAPLLAGLRVVAADRGGTIRESIAMGRVYEEVHERHGQSELLDAIVASPPGIDRSSVGDDLVAAAGQRLRDAVSVLEQKATHEELDDYRRFVLAVADAAARAHKEGGFIGIGGKEVSDAEQAALDEIASVLGAPSSG